MEFFDALILGVLQGITEFLPVSSSGHLVLGEEILGLEVANLKSFDVVVHLGTLLAIFIYFWNDVREIFGVVGRAARGKLSTTDPYARLIFYILIGTIPALIVGLTLEDTIDGFFRNATYVGGAMISVGLIFFFGEFIRGRFFNGASREITWWKAVLIGCAQAVALIPGVSRSGSTIVAGLFQGIDRSSAARFSFLLGIPAMAGAGLLTFISASRGGGFEVDLMPMIVGFVSSFVFGILSISFLMRFLKNHSLRVFGVYLVVVGLGSILLGVRIYSP